MSSYNAQPERALWCKFGSHPFGESDKGWRVISMSGANDYVTVSWTACANHIPGTPTALTPSTVIDEEV